jgi:hypothetical protein
MATAQKVRFYELNEQREVLASFLVETEGEETPEIAELWEKLSGDAENKAANWAKFTKELDLEAEMIEGMEAALKKELARLASERKAIEARVVKSRAELSRQMLLFGLVAAKTPGVSIWHVDEKPVVVTPDYMTLTREQLYDAHENLGILRFVPARTTVVEAHWEWDVDAIIAHAKLIEKQAAEAVQTEDVTVTHPSPLPPGVSVLFRKGIRVR